MSHGLTEGEPRLKVLAALDQPPEPEQGRPDHAMTSHLCGGVTMFLGQVQQLARDLVRRGYLAAMLMEHRASP